MAIGLAFWILMLIWAVFGIAWHFGYAGPYAIGINSLLLFVLFLLLGWHAFGPPLHG